VYNEEKNLQPLFEELRQVMEENYQSYEVIFVDDGSTDSSLEVLKGLREENPCIKIIEFEGNFGQTEAIQAGLDHAKGKSVVTMDSDMQNDPRDIPKMVEELEVSGCDMVNGWRKKRSDPLPKKISSHVASKMRRVFLGTDLHDHGCTLKAFRSEAAKSLDLKGEMHRYVPPLLRRRGYSVTEVEVNHRERYAGSTKYGLQRIPKGFMDMVNVWFWKKYERRPLHVFGGLGMLSMGSGALMFLVAIYQRLKGVTLSDTAATILSVFLVMIGLQFFISGMLADIAIRNGNKSEDSVYNVRKVIE